VQQQFRLKEVLIQASFSPAAQSLWQICLKWREVLRGGGKAEMKRGVWKTSQRQFFGEDLRRNRERERNWKRLSWSCSTRHFQVLGLFF